MSFRDRLRKLARSRAVMAVALLAVVGGQVVYPVLNELRQAERAQEISSSTQALGRMNFEADEIVRALFAERDRDLGPDARREFDAARERGLRAAGRVDALRAAYRDYGTSGRPEGGDPLVEELAESVVDAYAAQAARLAAIGQRDTPAERAATADLSRAAEGAGLRASALGDWIVERMPPLTGEKIMVRS